MKSTIVGALICLLPFPALAHHTPEHTKSMMMGEMSDPAPTPYEAPPPPEAFSGPAHAADIVFDPVTMAEAREVLRREQGAKNAYKIMVDRLEARMKEGNDDYLWDGQGWYGGDLNRLWIKTEGEGEFGEDPEEAELQVLWSRAITPWFDFQAGARHDILPGDLDRTYLVVGIQGLAPYFFELDAATFLSDEGDFTARFEGEYDQLLTQKLILQPRIELNFSAQDVPELGLGSGLTSVETGLRLRYEFHPEFAPYIGIGYERLVGDTADYARSANEDLGGWRALAGLRAWF